METQLPNPDGPAVISAGALGCDVDIQFRWDHIQGFQPFPAINRTRITTSVAGDLTRPHGGVWSGTPCRPILQWSVAETLVREVPNPPVFVVFRHTYWVSLNFTLTFNNALAGCESGARALAYTEGCRDCGDADRREGIVEP